MIFEGPTQLSRKEAIVNRILLVEDEPDTAASLKRVLEQHHYEVLVAKDGGQAQGTFVMKKPDFVILDLILPGESGFEICERFKQMDPAIPILIVSAIRLDDSRHLARRVGADGYLVKPVQGEELLASITDAADSLWQRAHETAPARTGTSDVVRFTCRCGRRFKVSGTHRGKTLTCPSCGEPVIVPRHD